MPSKKKIIDYIINNINCDIAYKSIIKQEMNGYHEYDILLCYQWLLKKVEALPVKTCKLYKPSKTAFENFYTKYCLSKKIRTFELKNQSQLLHKLRKAVEELENIYYF